MIMNYINMSFEEHDAKVSAAIGENELYKSSSDKFYNSIKSLDKKLQLEIESAASTMEAVTAEVAFDKGFQEGVKFIMECCKGEANKCA